MFLLTMPMIFREPCFFAPSFANEFLGGSGGIFLASSRGFIPGDKDDARVLDKVLFRFCLRPVPEGDGGTGRLSSSPKAMLD